MYPRERGRGQLLILFTMDTRQEKEKREETVSLGKAMASKKTYNWCISNLLSECRQENHEEHYKYRFFDL